MQRELAEVKQVLARNTTAAWVRWTIPLIATLVVAVYGFLQDSIAEVDVFAHTKYEESVSDRRNLAEQAAAMEATQRAQFERILTELQRLNAKIDLR